MADIDAFHFPYQGFSVPNGIPFYPIVANKTDENDQPSSTVKFVQGYVIDLTQQIPSIVKVEKCEGDGNTDGWPADNKYYVKVALSGNSVATAEIARIPDGEGENLPTSDKIFLLAEFDEETRELKKTILRQNILWSGIYSAQICPFNEIISKNVNNGPYKKYIRGGMIYCGDKNFLVEDLEITTSSSYERYYFFEIPCEVNRDDDGKILLPSIKTSTWNPHWSFTSSASFKDNTNPVVSTGLGKIIIPIGLVQVSDTEDPEVKNVYFSGYGCGDIRVNHCSGTLSFTRGA